MIGMLIVGCLNPAREVEVVKERPAKLVSDLGAVEVRGGGLPGYDINEDGEVDYIQFGFQHFVEIYKMGGFDYPGGIIQIQELPRGELQPSEIGRNITIPPMHFHPSYLAESSVGSVVIFSAKDEESGLEVDVVYKTLGRYLDTYSLLIRNEFGAYQIKDRIFEEDAGTIEKEEVEKLGVGFPKE